MFGPVPAKSSVRRPAALAAYIQKAEDEEIVQLQKSAQFQAFNEYLEIVNKDLQQKCQYLSTKIKSLESNAIKQVPPALYGDEMPQIVQLSISVMEMPAIDEIPNEWATEVRNLIEIEPALKNTFSCYYWRKSNLRAHISTCKAELALQPKIAKKKVVPCRIWKKNLSAAANFRSICGR